MGQLSRSAQVGVNWQFSIGERADDPAIQRGGREDIISGRVNRIKLSLRSSLSPVCGLPFTAPRKEEEEEDGGGVIWRRGGGG